MLTPCPRALPASTATPRTTTSSRPCKVLLLHQGVVGSQAVRISTCAVERWWASAIRTSGGRATRTPSLACEPSAVRGKKCYKLAGALREQRLPARLRADEGGVVVPPRYDRGDWKEGDGVFHAQAIAAYTRKLADRIETHVRAGDFPVSRRGPRRTTAPPWASAPAIPWTALLARSTVRIAAVLLGSSLSSPSMKASPSLIIGVETAATPGTPDSAAFTRSAEALLATT